jgi:hypothetical protein
MKCTIVSSRELLGSGCWKPARFLGGCHECASVAKCRLPQAGLGRLRLAQLRVAEAEEAVEEARRRLEAARADLGARLLQIGKHGRES